MKKIYLLYLLLGISYFGLSQIVDIPDPNFKFALTSTSCIDTNGDESGDVDADLNNDGEIQVSEAEAVSNLFLYSSANIASMEGIASFTNIETLFVVNNGIATLDVSQNTNLVRLYVYNNGFLTNLVVPASENLEELFCFNNELPSVDVSQNPNLKAFHCYANLFTELDVSNNPLLEDLACGGPTNGTSSINQITDLDLTQNPNLKFLYTYNNPFKSIDLTQNPLLEILLIGGNQLTELDLSQNGNLNELICDDNFLTSLSIKNGNNHNLSMTVLDNPTLECIDVDDVEVANAADWTLENTPAIYSEDCTSLGIVSNTNSSIEMYPNPVSDILHIGSSYPVNSMLLYSPEGKLVKESHSSRMAVRDLPKGIYFVVVKIEGSVFTKKIIKI